MQHCFIIECGEKMLSLEKSFAMPYNRRLDYRVLAKANLGIGQDEKSQKYLDLFSKLNDSINTEEKEGVEEPVKQIVKKTEKSYTEKVKTTTITAVVVINAFLLAPFFSGIRSRKNFTGNMKISSAV